MLSGRPQKVAKLGKLDFPVPGYMAVAAGCHARHGILRHAECHLSRGSFGSVADTRTSGRFIRAAFSQNALLVGGPLIDTNVGVLGVINSMGGQIKATPIDDVLKYIWSAWRNTGNNHLKVLRVLDHMVMRLLPKEELRVL